MANPRRPQMRDIENHHRNVLLAQLDDLLEAALAQIIGPVERRGRREQGNVVGRLAHQPVEHHGVHLVLGEHGVGDALGRVLVEIEPGGAERQVEIDDQHVLADRMGDGPGDIVRDGRRPRSTLGRNKADGPPDGRRAVGGEQIGDGVDDRAAVGGHHQIFGHPGPDQAAIEHHVVDMADDDDAGRGVAHLGQLGQRRLDPVGRQRRFDDDEVGRGVGAIGLHRAIEPAIMGGQRHLGHAPVLRRVLDDLGGLGVLAERLDGDARDQPCPRNRFGRGFGRFRAIFGFDKIHHSHLLRSGMRSTDQSSTKPTEPRNCPPWPPPPTP